MKGEGWNPIFTRSFNDWEMEETERLLLGLGCFVLHDDLEVIVCWKLIRDGVFSIRSMYLAL